MVHIIVVAGLVQIKSGHAALVAITTLPSAASFAVVMNSSNEVIFDTS